MIAQNIRPITQRLAVVAAGMAGIIGLVFGGPASPVHATPNIGPDPDDISYSDYYGLSFNPSIQRKFLYVLSRNEYADILSSRIKVYMPTPTGTIVVRDPHMCLNHVYVNSSPYSYYADNDISYVSGFGNITRYQLSNSAGSTATQYGQWNSSASCATATLTFNVSGSTVDPNTGMYPYVLQADALANGEYTNLFGVTAPTGAIISPDVTVSAQAFALHVSQPIPLPPSYEEFDPPHPYKNYTHWQLPFGPDCSVINPVVRDYVEFYDDDNFYDYEAQPRPFFLQMREYDRSGNLLGTIRPYGVRWSNSFGPLGPTHTTPATDANGGWVVNTINGSLYDHVYTTSDQKTMRAYYDFKRERVYKLFMHSVYMSNKVQIQLPFESVFYYKQCALNQATLQPSSTVDKSAIGYPETATFRHYLNVSDAVGAGSAGYSIQRYRNGAAIGSPQTGTTNFSTDGQYLVATNSFTSAVSDVGARICERLTLTGSGTFSNNPSEACTTVVSRPYLSADNNDVWAGARVDQNNNNCAGAAARTSTISSWVSGSGGAVGEYGVFGLGAITQFGSARQASGSGLTFANTPALGTLGAPTRCILNYFDAIGSSGAATWPGLGAVPAGGGKRKYIATGDLTITGGTLPAGTQAVLLVDGNVRITGNINLANSFSGAADINSLWIIAKGNIYIQENVTNISGLYVAQGTPSLAGTVHTCVRTGQVSTYNPLTTVVCGNALTVQGALIADRMLWQRTAGTAGAGTAAEWANFDIGLYMATPLQVSGGAGLIIEDVQELPPVY